MNADYQDYKYKELTESIIRIFYKVYNKLGYGFLEKVYENAMMLELKRENIKSVLEKNLKLDGWHIAIIENNNLSKSAFICVRKQIIGRNSAWIMKLWHR